MLGVGAMLEEIAAYTLRKEGEKISLINRTSDEARMRAHVGDLSFSPFATPVCYPGGLGKNTRSICAASKRGRGSLAQ